MPKYYINNILENIKTKLLHDNWSKHGITPASLNWYSDINCFLKQYHIKNI